LLKDAGLDGAVLVTTPSKVALIDVQRQLAFCKKGKRPPLFKAQKVLFEPKKSVKFGNSLQKLGLKISKKSSYFFY